MSVPLGLSREFWLHFQVIPAIDTSDMDPELARYLNRNYWQKRSEDTKTATTMPSAPSVTSTPQNTMGKISEVRNPTHTIFFSIIHISWGNGAPDWLKCSFSASFSFFSSFSKNKVLFFGGRGSLFWQKFFIFSWLVMLTRTIFMLPANWSSKWISQSETFCMHVCLSGKFCLVL